MVNVIPLEDSAPHRLNVACLCEPRVEFSDPHSADPKHFWSDGPIVIHNSFDGREEFERRNFPTGKKWMTLRS